MTLATPAAELAKAIAARLQGSDFRPGKPEDLGGNLAQLQVTTGERRTPGAHYSVVDTERVFVVNVVEQPKGQ